MRRFLGVACVVALVVAGNATPVSADPPPVRVIPRDGTVALTFDDGPHPEWTPIVLDILDAYGVKATFFVAGFRAERHPEIVADIAARGHSVQNHTFGHENLVEYGNRTISWTLIEANRVIRDTTGSTPTCMRPPFGSTSRRVLDVISEHNLHVVMWDINTRDYAHNSASAAVTHALRAEPGDILLMHDIHGYLWVDALPRVIEGLQARGIGFDTLCERPDPTGRAVRWPGFRLWSR